MQITDIVKWNKRVSLIYAVGVWTLMGTYGFYTYTGHYDIKPETLTGRLAIVSIQALEVELFQAQFQAQSC